jgi:hypothetical protein
VPIALSTGQNVSRVVTELVYDSALLSVTGFNTTIAGATSQFAVVTAGRIRVTVSSSAQFSASAGAIELGRLTASVPDTAPYASKHVLDLQNVQVFDATPGTPQLRTSRDGDGVHVAAYFGDTTGNRAYAGTDVTLLQRVVVGSATGLAAFPVVDPALIADINGSGAINGSDVTFLQRVVVGTPVSFVPPLPGGQSLRAGGERRAEGGEPDGGLGSGEQRAASREPDAGLAMTPAQLAPVVEEAVGLWAATGLSPAQVARLRATPVVIANLDAQGYLGLTTPQQILIDDNGVGLGWELPWAISHWSSANGQWPLANDQSYDLLTTVLHELGHVLGHGHDADDELMDAVLQPGEHHLPDVDSVFAGW